MNNAVRIETTTVKTAGFGGVQAAVLAFQLFCALFTTAKLQAYADLITA